MPFSGDSYTLPSGSIIANGTRSNASQHNTPLQDIESALTIVKTAVTATSLFTVDPAESPAGAIPGQMMLLTGASSYNPEVDDVLAAQQTSAFRDVQNAGLWLRMPSIVGNNKVSPADAEELGDYWMRLCAVPGWTSHPEDIYPDMGIGWGAGYPMLGGRSTAIGYYAGSNTTYVDTTDTPTPVGSGSGEADPVKYAGLAYLPIPWGTFLGERAGRGSRDSSPTFIGQQAGLGATGYNTIGIGRFSYWGASGYYSIGIGNSALRSAKAVRSVAMGDAAGSFSELNYSNAFGQRSLAYSVVLNALAYGYETGAYAALQRGVFIGYRAGYKLDGIGNVIIGDTPVAGGEDTGKAATCQGPDIDVYNSRFKLPAGTLASWSVASGDNVAVSYDPAGLTRPPENWEDVTAFIGVALIDGADEYICTYTGASPAGGLVTEANKRAEQIAWAASGGSDQNPDNYTQTTAWASGVDYDVRWPDGATVAHDPTDVVTHGGSTWFCLVPHTSSAATEPGVGASYATYWERTDSTGTYTLTPNKKVDNSVGIGRAFTLSGDNSVVVGYDASATANETTAVGKGADASAAYATAIGREAVASHTNSTAIGRGATTTATNQVQLGDASVTSLYLGNALPVQFVESSGTFTPVLKGSTTDPTITYTTQTGSWHVINMGGTKMCRGRIFIATSTATGGTGNMSIQVGSGSAPPVAKTGTTTWGRPVYVKTWASSSAFPAFWRVASAANAFDLYQPNGASDARLGVALSAASVHATTNEIQIDFEYEVT